MTLWFEMRKKLPESFCINTILNPLSTACWVADNKSGISCSSAIMHTNGVIRMYRDVLLTTFFTSVLRTKPFLCMHMRTWKSLTGLKCNNPFVETCAHQQIEKRIRMRMERLRMAWHHGPRIVTTRTTTTSTMTMGCLCCWIWSSWVDI